MEPSYPFPIARSTRDKNKTDEGLKAAKSTLRNSHSRGIPLCRRGLLLVFLLRCRLLCRSLLGRRGLLGSRRSLGGLGYPAGLGLAGSGLIGGLTRLLVGSLWYGEKGWGHELTSFLVAVFFGAAAFLGAAAFFAAGFFSPASFLVAVFLGAAFLVASFFAAAFLGAAALSASFLA